MTSIQTINRPVRFNGTEEERVANRLSHHFVTYDQEEPAECMDCCARTYHVAADYPCGVEPAREVVVYEYDYNDAEREDH